MQKTEFVKDITLGILLIVIAQFPFTLVSYLSKSNSFLVLFGILGASIIGYRLLVIGINLIRGIDLAKPD